MITPRRFIRKYALPLVGGLILTLTLPWLLPALFPTMNAIFISMHILPSVPLITESLFILGSVLYAGKKLYDLGQDVYQHYQDHQIKQKLKETDPALSQDFDHIDKMLSKHEKTDSKTSSDSSNSFDTIDLHSSTYSDQRVEDAAKRRNFANKIRFAFDKNKRGFSLNGGARSVDTTPNPKTTTSTN